MWFAAAIGSALLFGLAGWWMKVSQMQGGANADLCLGLYLSGAAGFAVNGAIEGTLDSALTDPRVWIAGLFIGAGSALGNALFMKAMAYGPASLTSPLTNMNIVLVIGLGTFVYNEPLTAFELTGIVLLLAAVVFISVRRSGQRQALRRKWHLYVGLSILLFAVRNGGLKVTDEMGLHGTPVLFAAYALSFLGFAWVVLRNWMRAHASLQSQSEPQPEPQLELQSKRQSSFGLSSRSAAASNAAGADDEAAHPADRAGFMTDGSSAAGNGSSAVRAGLKDSLLRSAASTGLKWGLIAGLFSYAGLQLYAVALQTGQASIAAPVFATNGLVVAAGSILVYRERLTALQWSAFVLTIAGLILIRL